LDKVPVYRDKTVSYESNFIIADSTFFNVFPIGMVSGNSRNALSRPNTMAISRKLQHKLFGDKDPVGEIVNVDFDYGLGKKEFEITAVFNDVPLNSHFHYDLLVSSHTFPDLINNPGWSANNFISYLKLKPGTNPGKFNGKLREFTRKYMGGDSFDEWVSKGNFWIYYLQPMRDIHLESDLNGEFETNGNKSYVLLFSVISIFILLIACINFMSLSTAKSSVRAMEVGVRKVYGARRTNLVNQFMGETILISYISIFLAIILVELFLPVYNSIIGRELSINYQILIPLLLIGGIIIGSIAGSYPSLLLSRFNPVVILRGKSGNLKTGELMRRVLVVFQFSISVILIISTLVVFLQLKYLSNKELGFLKENRLVISNPGKLKDKTEVFKQSLAELPDIKNVSGSNIIPGHEFSNIGFGAEEVESSFSFNIGVCDTRYQETMGIELKSGRFFSEEFPFDSCAAVLNSKAAKLLGWEDNALNKNLNNWNPELKGEFHVIGVIEDFHYESLHSEIRPMALFLNGGYYNRTERFIIASYKTQDLQNLLVSIEGIWENFSAEPFEYSFLEEEYDNLYLNEIRTRKLFGFFTFLSIVIAGLGLFGLSSFIADQKRKEIGIRKAMGASRRNIVSHLNQRFLVWVLIANFIGIPLSYILMNKWLENFVYHIDIPIWVSVITLLLTVIISYMVVTIQTYKAATRNPAETLRYE
jgi:putative ABC transport system permease protein